MFQQLAQLRIKPINLSLILATVVTSLTALAVNPAPAEAGYVTIREGGVTVRIGDSYDSDFYGSPFRRVYRSPYEYPSGPQIINGRIDDSTLINPVIIDSRIEDSELINPVVIDSPYDRRTVIRRSTGIAPLYPSGRRSSCTVMSSIRMACQ